MSDENICDLWNKARGTASTSVGDGLYSQWKKTQIQLGSIENKDVNV
jgi:hypothetical protein